MSAIRTSKTLGHQLATLPDNKFPAEERERLRARLAARKGYRWQAPSKLEQQDRHLIEYRRMMYALLEDEELAGLSIEDFITDLSDPTLFPADDERFCDLISM